jgi:Ni/Fe-hydrogenase subunit HybB-like protein
MAGEKLETVPVEQKAEKGPQINTFGEFWSFFKSELTPKGNLSTAFNLLSGIAMIGAFLFLVIRFTVGLGQPVTNLNQSFPWGLWMGFSVMSGAALAGGGYVLAFIVCILGVKKYRPVLRPALLNSFVFYVFCSVAIVIGFGRWWNIPNIFIGNGFGANSVMFIVVWLFLLYIVTTALEFSPALAEWIENRKMRKTAGALVLGAAAFGITISVLHQAGLGALMLMAKGKIHPLWYSELLPVMFFVSSIYAGLSLVIFEGTISRKVFTSQMDEEHRTANDDIVLGLARICGGVIFGYFALTLIIAKGEGDFAFIWTRMGYWWLLEVIGFVAIPGLMFIHGAQKKNPVTVRAAAIIAMVGILLNRYNNVFLAYNWNLPFAEKYHPSFVEGLVAVAIVCAQIWVFRWAVNRMPVMRKSPQWASNLDRDPLTGQRR